MASIANNIGIPTISSGPLSSSLSPSVSPHKPSEDDSEDKKEVILETQEEKKETIPIVFHWDHGGNEIYVCGSFNNWMKIPMTRRWVEFYFHNYSVN